MPTDDEAKFSYLLSGVDESGTKGNLGK